MPCNRDTLIIRDTVPLLRQKVVMVTPYIQLTGLIENKRLKGDIKVPVTLNQAVWVEYKGWCFQNHHPLYSTQTA